jgi:hypothetical protein
LQPHARACVVAQHDELGIEPGHVLRELQRRVLVQDPVLKEADRLSSVLGRTSALLPVRRTLGAKLF